MMYQLSVHTGTFVDPRRGQGFTIFEMTIVLLIVSVISLTLVMLVRTGLAALQQEQALRIAQNAQTAIDGFIVHANGGRYPCPANPSVAVGAATFGQEDCTMTTFPGTKLPLGSGDVMVGYLPDYVSDGNVSNPGWIPLTSLLPKEDLIQTNLRDPWGNRLIYAVTTALTDKAEFSNNVNNGQIKLVDETGEYIGRSNGLSGGMVQYVIISQGKFGGAACLSELGLNPGARPLEYDNCSMPWIDSGGNLVDGRDAIFRKAIRSTADDVNYFDDIVVYREDLNQFLWASEKANNWASDAGNSSDTDNRNMVYNPSPTNPVVIGTSAEVSGDALYVEGNVRVGSANTGLSPSGYAGKPSSGTLMANLICDNSQSSDGINPSPYCLNFGDPSKLFEFHTDCDPPGGVYPKRTVYDYANKKFTIMCEPLDITLPPGYVEQPCASNLVVGVYTNGDVVCYDVP
jgi:type II secretory pathway pseudopilin PulG